jgi:hypothetical protein
MYTTSQNYTKLDTIGKTLHNSINSTKLDNTLQSLTTLYKHSTHHYNNSAQLYNTSQNYKTFYNFQKLFKTLYNFTKLYKTLHNAKNTKTLQPKKTRQDFTKPTKSFNSVQTNSTQLYKTLYKKYNKLHNFTCLWK